MRMFTEIGRRVPLHATGVGKALLAAMSPGDVEAAMARTGMPARTPTTLTDPGRLRAELDVARTRGWVLDEGEQEVGVRCVAAPVPGAPTPCAVSVSGPAARFGPDEAAEAGPAVVAAAARLGQELAGVRTTIRAKGTFGRLSDRRGPSRGTGRAVTPSPSVAVCWDVDGTLLRGGVVGREVLEQAFTTVTGHPAPEEQVLMPGRTDWLIGEALRDALPDEHATPLRGRGDAFGHDMIAEVGAEWARREPDLADVAHTLPGIPETIAALAAEPGVVQTLTTGNVRAGARAKLAAVGLADGPIDLALGGYGEGPGERVRVVTAARDALVARYGTPPRWSSSATPRSTSRPRTGRARSR